MYTQGRSNTQEISRSHTWSLAAKKSASLIANGKACRPEAVHVNADGFLVAIVRQDSHVSTSLGAKGVVMRAGNVPWKHAKADAKTGLACARSFVCSGVRSIVSE